MVDPAAPASPEAVFISNTSPLTYLHKIRRLELMHDLCGVVLVPNEVAAELSRGRALGFDLPDLAAHAWLDVRGSADAGPYGDLGAGETGALNLARTIPGAVVILDDRAAREWAVKLNLGVTGTLGLLTRAKARGLIAAVAPELDRLRDAGFRLTAPVRATILARCGEA